MTTILSSALNATIDMETPAVQLARAMFSSVIAYGFQFKVLVSVVELVFVVMVRNFLGGEGSPNLFREGKAVDSDIAVLSSVGVVGLFDKQVSIAHRPALPKRTFFASFLWGCNRRLFSVEALLRTKGMLLDVAWLAVNGITAMEALELRLRFQAFARAKYVWANRKAGWPSEGQLTAGLTRVRIVHARIIQACQGPSQLYIQHGAQT